MVDQMLFSLAEAYTISLFAKDSGLPMRTDIYLELRTSSQTVPLFLDTGLISMFIPISLLLGLGAR